jgi:catalase
MPPQARLIDNIVTGMNSVPQRFRRSRFSASCKADPAYGRGVAARVGIELAEAAAV